VVGERVQRRNIGSSFDDLLKKGVQNNTTEGRQSERAATLGCISSSGGWRSSVPVGGLHGRTTIDTRKRLPAFFYALPSGREPVREWLLSLDRDIKDVEFSWPIGMPLCRPLGDGLWEVRSDLSGNRIGRVLFGIAGGRMVLLQAFVKKTRKTPDGERRLALKRLKEVT
jgi:phage-related protein